VTGHAEFRPDGEGPFSGESTVKGLNLVDLAGLADLNLQQTRGEVDGTLKFSGLITNADSFAADGEFTRFQLSYSQIPGAKRGYELWNPFSLRWKLAGDTLNIDRMRLLGDGTDIVVDGTVGLEDGFAGSEDSMNLTVEGIFNLAVLESFRPGLEASGESELDVRIAGSANQPAVRGRMGIKGGALRHSSFSNGLSALNGMVRFNEDTIQVEEVTAESGGGRLRLNGTAVREADRWDYRLQGQIESVRVRYPESLSSVVDGQLTYSGTDLRSLLAGEVVVSRVGIGSELSLGDIIASLAEPTKTPASNAALVNMGLSVRIASVPNLSIETPLIRDVQAYMDLQLGGTAVSPSLRGDMKITQGQVLFQGSRYTITRGDINFYNPFRIEPVVNIELETRIRDVDIALTISGPARLPNLSYRSDPPLRWDELFNLIALARSPTTDPVLASQQTIQQQSLIQGGGNAVFYRALTNPATGGSGRGSQRLQRFFGVSRLKVDPRGGAELNPGARISTEQQITHDLTLLYSYDLSEAQQQVVRVEWTPVRQWSFIVTRDENGLVGADVIFNKRLR
jgi:translocation and assembly module TamB